MPDVKKKLDPSEGKFLFPLETSLPTKDPKEMGVFLQNLVSGQVPHTTVAPDVTRTTERQVAPGITAVGQEAPRAQVAQTPGQSLDPQELVKALRDPNDPITEISFADGTTLKSQPTRLEAPRQSLPSPPDQDQSVSTPSIPKQSFGDFIKSPSFRFILGQIAQTIGGPGSIGAGLGKLGADLAQGQAFASFQQRLDAGESVGDIKGSDVDVLVPELRQQAIQTFEQRQKTKLEERKVAVEENRATDYSSLVRAQIDGTISAEDKLKVAELDRILKSKQVEHGRFLKINDVTVFDAEKQEFIQTTGGGASGAFSVGKLTPPQQEQFMKFVGADFLAQAQKRFVEKLVADGESVDAVESTRRALQFFEFDEASGSVNWQKILNFLNDEEKGQFRKLAEKYVTDHLHGIPATFTFSQDPLKEIQAQTTGAKPVVRP